MARTLLRPAALCTVLSLAFHLIASPGDLSPPEVQRLRSAARRSKDGESMLARGLKIPFRDCGVYELELIPKVSDTLAFRLMTHKRAIIARGRSLPVEESYRAFEIVKGIGPKTAKMLAAKLDLR